MAGQIKLLDCTLRDGGYINDWFFGRKAIDFILKKLVEAHIDYIELGFLKGDYYSEDRTIYPDVISMRGILRPKSKNTFYVGMVDMSDPLPLDRLPERTEEDIDAIRVIFKQDRLDEGVQYIKEVKKRGYLAMAQLVSTDTYSDDELVNAMKTLNNINPHAVYIVDSLGIIKNDEFLRMVYIMDHNLNNNIRLGYHSHNNLQLAMGNATSFVNIGLNREILVDACVFGMGRGAGNLNEELFADYLNEKFSKTYLIEPMLEIIDEHLSEIYKTNFWGYSLPFYLTASNKVHPNYGKYYNAKGTLTEKAFNELLKTIKPEDTHIYSAKRAEEYYAAYMDKYVDDSQIIQSIKVLIGQRNVLLICPGFSIHYNKDLIRDLQKKHDLFTLAVGFIPDFIEIDCIFCSNMRRFKDIKTSAHIKIITSNIKCDNPDSFKILNYGSYLGKNILVKDNSGLMALRMLSHIGVKKAYIVGMDGYYTMSQIDANRDVWDSDKCFVDNFNKQMSEDVSEISKKMEIEFSLPSKYVKNK